MLHNNNNNLIIIAFNYIHIGRYIKFHTIKTNKIHNIKIHIKILFLYNTIILNLILLKKPYVKNIKKIFIKRD